MMTKAISRALLAVCLAVAVYACKNNQKEGSGETPDTRETGTKEKVEITVPLEPRSGTETSGMAVFTEHGENVSLKVTFAGLTEGTHAIHLHEESDCSAPDGSSAGGHWNPTFEQHGRWGNPEGYHKGDIGNFEVNESGRAVLKFITDEWCIGCDDPTKDILGRAVIVHEKADDYVTQPTGDAGGRVSCGGIIEL